MTSMSSSRPIFDANEVLRVAARVPSRVMRSRDALLRSLEAICAVEDPIKEQAQSLTDRDDLALAAPLACLLQSYGPDLREVLCRHGKGSGNAKLAALLALFEPDASDADFFSKVQTRGAKLGWLGDALLEPEDHPDLMAQVTETKERLRNLQTRHPVLFAPSQPLLEKIAAFQSELRRLYREEGSVGARVYLEAARADQETELGRYLAIKSP